MYFPDAFPALHKPLAWKFMLSVLIDMMEFAFTEAWDEGDSNDVVWFCLMALIASEVCSFDDGDNGGGNEVDVNKDECN